MMTRVHRPHPAAPLRHDVTAHLEGFANSLDALLTRNIDRAPRYLQPVLHAAKAAALKMNGKSRAEICKAANAAVESMLYHMQVQPYPCPRCKKTGDPRCPTCGGRGEVRWHGDFGGGPR